MSISFESPDRAKVRERLQSMSNEESISYSRASRKLRNIGDVLGCSGKKRGPSGEGDTLNPELTQPLRRHVMAACWGGPR